MPSTGDDDPTGLAWGRAQNEWLHSEAGLRRLGLWTPAGLSAAGLAASAVTGAGEQALTASAGPRNRPKDPGPGEFKRELDARRKVDVTTSRKIAQARLIIAAMRAEARAELRRRVHEGG